MTAPMRLLAATTALAAAAGCVEDTGSSANVAPGRASLGQVEQACVIRLAQTANVATSAIAVTASTGSSEGTAVFLGLNGAAWVCRADGAGNIMEVQFQGQG